MTRLDRRTLLAGMGIGLLGACQPGPDESDLAEVKKPPEGGIGGTGIVGVLTDFSSLIVNGLRVSTGAEMRVTTALGPAQAADLAIGQSLTIEAAMAADGLDAKRVHIDHPVIGTVFDAAADGMSGQVAGVPVLIEPGGLGRLRTGARVAVSGLWQDDRVVSSRVDLAAPGPDVLAGVVRLTGGSFKIGPQTVLSRGKAAPPEGSFVTITGRGDPVDFQATEVMLGRFTGAAGPLRALSVEGYLDPISAAPYHALSGLGHSFDPEARLAPFRDGRTVFSGPYSGTFDVATGLTLPEEFQTRRALIRRIAAGEQSKLLRSTR